jgi:predicted kinase
VATLVLMIGLPGSGKTTEAKQIERERAAVRLTPDEWVTALHGRKPSAPVLDAAREPIETAQWRIAQLALALGLDVVLDFGLWTRAERESFRARATALGAGSELRYCAATLDELRGRIAARNAALPEHAFRIEDDEIRRWWAAFEPPDDDELRPRAAP